MASPGRKPGTPKTGGRKPGTPNRGTRELRDHLAAAMGPGWCPVVALARIAEDPDTEVALKVRCFAEVAPYLYPKRKALDHGLPTSLEDLISSSLADKLKAARERVVAGRVSSYESNHSNPARPSPPADQPLVAVPGDKEPPVSLQPPPPVKPSPLRIPIDDNYAETGDYTPLEVIPWNSNPH